MSDDVERTLPPHANAARKTPTFTASTVPDGLLKAHRTTVWAQLVVVTGRVVFVEEDPHWQVELLGPARQPIVPHRKHHVEPSPEAEFFVQFYDVG